MATKPRRRLPIGLQTLRHLHERDCYYVDKTAYVARLVDQGTHYFLSRPRRFGKSLLLDTFREAFEGNEALFAGLAIHDRWDWSLRHPVLRLDFGGGHFAAPGALESNVTDQLAAAERRAGVGGEYRTASGRLAGLIEALHRQAGRRVVVLVDEYDKPILDALDTPAVARANRDCLRGLYATIKSADEHVRFVFLAGVSRFSRVSLFSGLNNLQDITLDPRYAAICGYTETDLDAVFAPELPGLDRQRIREWYDGYHWRGAEKVYNPFAVLLLFDTGEFAAHWFETATPTFLVDMLLRRRVSALALDGMLTTAELLSAFDVDAIATEALLFQTGYLTIREEHDRGGVRRYRLGFPNREVRQGFNQSLLLRLVQDGPGVTANCVRLYELLAAADFRGLEILFRAFFAGIPYEWYASSAIARYEGYYASVFYAWFAASGLDVVVEESSGRGRADMTVRFGGAVLVFEFKVLEQAGKGAALAQLKTRGYADKYRASGGPIHLIGVEFSSETRNVTAFEVERA